MATLRRFLREGTPWCGLTATEEQASGSTLRRCLARWAETGLLARAHALLVGMLRGHPDLILDTCSVRAKRGGDLTGPNPTDRAKRGTKYHVAVDGAGVPVACAATAANTRGQHTTTRSFSNGCSWPPSRSWPASARCSPTKGRYDTVGEIAGLPDRAYCCRKSGWRNNPESDKSSKASLRHSTVAHMARIALTPS